MNGRQRAGPAPVDANQPDDDPAAVPEATMPIERTPDVAESEAHPS